MSRISAVPAYAGLRCFSEGWNFEQWTGNDSKALMKVYIAAIAGIVPDKIVKCFSAFTDACYIFRRNVILSTALHKAQSLVEFFHELRKVFIDEGVWDSISLLCQHALSHYAQLIIQFGSPNGLCSSITESKHIKAVKEPWRWSSRFKALVQMLRCIIQLEKMAAFRRELRRKGLLIGSTAASFWALIGAPKHEDTVMMEISDLASDSEADEHSTLWHCKSSADDHMDDVGPENGPQSLRSISLAATPGMFYSWISVVITCNLTIICTQSENIPWICVL